MVRCNVDGTWDLGDLRCEGVLNFCNCTWKKYFQALFVLILAIQMTGKPFWTLLRKGLLQVLAVTDQDLSHSLQKR